MVTPTINNNDNASSRGRASNNKGSKRVVLVVVGCAVVLGTCFLQSPLDVSSRTVVSEDNVYISVQLQNEIQANHLAEIAALKEEHRQALARLEHELGVEAKIQTFEADNLKLQATRASQKQLEQLEKEKKKIQDGQSATEKEVETLKEQVAQLRLEKEQQTQKEGQSTAAAAEVEALKKQIEQFQLEKQEKEKQTETKDSEAAITTASPPAANPKMAQHQAKGPIIVVGMPKSGTTSVYTYFTCSQVRTQHYCSGGDLNDHPPCKHGLMSGCMLDTMKRRLHGEKVKLLELCGNYTVYAQLDGERPARPMTRPDGSKGKGAVEVDGSLDPMSSMRMFLPQRFHLQELHDDYPHATFVLPVRAPQAWASSVTRWGRLYTHFGQEYFYQSNRTAKIPSGWDKTGKAKWLAGIYNEHLAYVQKFVKEHPSHTLITVNITDPQAGQIMEDAFGFSQECWGHANHNTRNTTKTGK